MAIRSVSHKSATAQDRTAATRVIATTPTNPSAELRESVLGLAILRSNMLQFTRAYERLRDEIEATTPGASRLARNRAFLADAIRDHNALATS